MESLLSLLVCRRRQRHGCSDSPDRNAGAEVAAREEPHRLWQVRRSSVDFPSLGLLADAPEELRQELLLAKVRACCITYDFSTSERQGDKTAKTLTLLEIVEYVSGNQHAFQESYYPEFMQMVAVNIARSYSFRRFHPLARMDMEEQEPYFEPNWIHLQSVYEFFLRFTVSDYVNPKVVKKYIKPLFINHFVEGFLSEDPRERDYLKTILHRFYGRFVSLRLHVKKALRQFLFRFVYEIETTSGVAELLEVVGCIINGFSVPLKADNVELLEKALLPMQRAKSLQQFYPQLAFCLTQYVAKVPELSQNILWSALNSWPHQSAFKQVSFLNTIEVIILADVDQVSRCTACRRAVFMKVANCIEYNHFHVAERALLMWSRDPFVALVADQRQAIFPIVAPSLARSASAHWSKTIRVMAEEVMSRVRAQDETLFEKCLRAAKDSAEREEEIESRRQRMWAAAAAEAKAAEEVVGSSRGS